MVARSLPLPNLSLRDALEALAVAALRAIHGVLLVYVRRWSVALLFRFFYGRYTSGCISCRSAWYTTLGVSGEEMAVGNGSGKRTRESVPCFVNLPTTLCSVVMTVRLKALALRSF